MSDLFLSEP